MEGENGIGRDNGIGGKMGLWGGNGIEGGKWDYGGKWDLRRKKGWERAEWDGRKENGIVEGKLGYYSGGKWNWKRGNGILGICFPIPPALNPLLPLWNVPEPLQFPLRGSGSIQLFHSHKSQSSFPKFRHGTFPHSQGSIPRDFSASSCYSIKTGDTGKWLLAEDSHPKDFPSLENGILGKLLG